MVDVRGPDSYVVERRNGSRSNVNIRDIKEYPQKPIEPTKQPNVSDGNRSHDEKEMKISFKPPLIGSRVKVFWPKQNKFYNGEVLTF